MRILHFIDSLNYGGAETLLMSYIPLLNNHEHFVVTMRAPNLYKQDKYEYIELDATPVAGVVKAALAIRKIVAKKHIDIVHSHSFWTNIISRLGAPGRVKLINHYHFADYDTMKYKSAVRKMILLDRVTAPKRLIRVAVSEYVAKVLKGVFPNGNVKLIPNFIDCTLPTFERKPANRRELRVVAVGSCNVEKNYGVVFQAFEALKEEPITIDIIGGGDRLETYMADVKRMGLNKVRFCGLIPNVKEHLANYDLFLSASISETFGLAVLEGICAKLPLLISNIPAFNEIAPASAQFFDPYDKNELVKHLLEFLNNRRDPDLPDYNRILHKYSASSHLEELMNLYNS